MRIPRLSLRACQAVLMAVVLWCALPACARSQWLMVVTTDAELPSWGDRVLIEMLDEQGGLACTGCRREISVSSTNVPFTFGLVPPDRAVRVRARLYHRSQTGPDGLPSGTDLIDYVGLLPLKEPSGSERLAVPLFSFCFGAPADLAAHTSCTYTNTGFEVLPERTLDPDVESVRLVPGKFSRRLRIGACPASVPDDMACLPGNAFLMGSTDSLGVDTDYPTSPRFVAQYFYPILVDKDEMTVGAVRALVRAGFSLGSSSLLKRGAGEDAACTYLSASDASNDALPINCVSQLAARSICRELGKELLTEIDWEYAATGGGNAATYPWGEDPPTCERAVLSVSPSCSRSGPVAGGAPGDVTPQGIRNLGGNLSEWVATIFVPYTDSCWRERGAVGGLTLADPDACYGDSRWVGWPGPWPHRGGSFARRGTSATATARFASPKGAPSPNVGFRCKKTLINAP